MIFQSLLWACDFSIFQRIQIDADWIVCYSSATMNIGFLEFWTQSTICNGKTMLQQMAPKLHGPHESSHEKANQTYDKNDLTRK